MKHAPSLQGQGLGNPFRDMANITAGACCVCKGCPTLDSTTRAKFHVVRFVKASSLQRLLCAGQNVMQPVCGFWQDDCDLKEAFSCWLIVKSYAAPLDAQTAWTAHAA